MSEILNIIYKTLSENINKLTFSGETEVYVEIENQFQSYFNGQHIDRHDYNKLLNETNYAYDADAGLLITTAKETEEIENYITEVSEEIDKTIDLMAGADVARFVLRYAPELVL